MTFAQKSLENYSCEKGIMDLFTPSQGSIECLLSTHGAVELHRSRKGKIENVLSPERPVNPLTALQELSRHTKLTQSPHQH